jgi:hypothetical protein
VEERLLLKLQALQGSMERGVFFDFSPLATATNSGAVRNMRVFSHSNPVRVRKPGTTTPSH